MTITRAKKTADGALPPIIDADVHADLVAEKFIDQGEPVAIPRTEADAEAGDAAQSSRELEVRQC